MRNYAQLKYINHTSAFSSVSHTVFSGSLTEDRGVVAIDFVDSDEQYPELARDRAHKSTQSARDASVRYGATGGAGSVVGLGH